MISYGVICCTEFAVLKESGILPEVQEVVVLNNAGIPLEVCLHPASPRVESVS